MSLSLFDWLKTWSSGDLWNVPDSVYTLSVNA